MSSVNIKVKQQILDEFAAKESILQNNKIGFYLSRNVGLHSFKYRHSEWRDFEMEKDRKRKMFADLMTDDRRSVEKGEEPAHRSNSNYNQNNHQTNSSSNYDQQNNSHHSFNNRAFNSHDGQSHYKRPRHGYRQSPHYR